MKNLQKESVINLSKHNHSRNFDEFQYLSETNRLLNNSHFYRTIDDGI